MSKKNYLLCIVLLIGFLSGSAQPVHLLHKPFRTKYCYIDSIRSVLSISPEKIPVHQIQSTIEWAKSKQEGELEVLLTLLQCRLRADQGQTTIQDSVEQQMKKMLADYGKRPCYASAEILQSLGFFYYFVLNKNNVSFEHYLQAYSQYKDMDPREFPGKRTYIYELSGSYFRFGDHRNATKYLKEALATPQGACGADLENTCYNTIGVSFQALGVYDSALFFFRHGKELAIQKKDDRWIGIFNGNIGSIYFLQGNYEPAIPLLEQSIELSLAEKQRRSALSAICTLADAFLILKKDIKAEQYLRKADSILQQFAYLRSYELTSHLSRVKAKLFAARGNATATWLYADSAMKAMDSVNSRKMASNQLKTIDREQYVQQKYDRERVESERRLQVLVRDSLIVLILLMTVIAILVISRQRLKHKKLEADKKYAESELAVATTKLFGFRQRESEKDELIEQLKKDDEEQEDLQARVQLENAILLTDEQWDEFRRQFEKVHPGFFSNLKKKIPDLTPAETRFLALTKLKLSPKEMTAMLGISLNAIRVYRYRLRKRLNLDKDQTIDHLVEKL